MNSCSSASPDADAVQAWEAALAQGRFCIQQCRDCGLFGFPPAACCRHCGAEALRWVVASGRAVVHSTAVALQTGAAPVSGLPALVVLELEEGPHMAGRVMDVEPADLKPGLPVSAHVGLLAGQPAVLFYNKEQGSREW